MLIIPEPRVRTHGCSHMGWIFVIIDTKVDAVDLRIEVTFECWVWWVAWIFAASNAASVTTDWDQAVCVLLGEILWCIDEEILEGEID